MKWLYISLCCLLSASCINNEKKQSFLFNEKVVNRWEKATIDRINNIYERNKYNQTDTFYLEQLSYFKENFYNPNARLHFFQDLRYDTIFNNAECANPL